MAAQHYDAVVIGAGQAGVPLATTLAMAGRKPARVEREHVGGTRINEGCTLTKTMVASAKVAYFDRRSADYGVSDGQVNVDMVAVRQRKRDIVKSFRSGGKRRLHDAGRDRPGGTRDRRGGRPLASDLAAVHRRRHRVGMGLGILNPAVGAVMVVAGLLSDVLFPLSALTILRGKRVAPDDPDGHEHAGCKPEAT